MGHHQCVSMTVYTCDLLSVFNSHADGLRGYSKEGGETRGLWGVLAIR